MGVTKNQKKFFGAVVFSLYPGPGVTSRWGLRIGGHPVENPQRCCFLMRVNCILGIGGVQGGGDTCRKGDRRAGQENGDRISGGFTPPKGEGVEEPGAEAGAAGVRVHG